MEGMRLAFAVFVALVYVQFQSAHCCPQDVVDCAVNCRKAKDAYGCDYCQCNVVDFCRTKPSGNYWCSDGTSSYVCSCYGRKQCSTGSWYDPSLDDCTWSREFLIRLINCLDETENDFSDSPSTPDARFCRNRDDGNYPCDSTGSELCACYYGEQCDVGQWYDSTKPGCTDLTYDMITKIIACVAEPEPSDAQEPTTEPATSGKVCPDDYEGPSGEDFCYKAILEAMSYEDAKRRCVEDNPRAHLAYALDSDQNDDINKYLTQFTGNSQCYIAGASKEIYYTSGQRKYPEECSRDSSSRTNKFVWKVNSTTTIEYSVYQHWRAGEPNCYGSYGENCLVYRCEDMDTEATRACYWNDYYCALNACLLCQIDL